MIERTDLVDEEGENQAVRCFLQLYGGCIGQPTIGRMRQHLKRSGFADCEPNWVTIDTEGQGLTKAGAQLWIRHLFSLEQQDQLATATQHQDDLRTQLQRCHAQVRGLQTERDQAITERNNALVRAITAEQRLARPDAEPEWVVNDLGELGVKVGARFYFLYKGDNIEYTTGLHDDGTPMLWRMVGKREFGETCWPMKWIKAGRREHRYTQELEFIPGLSFGAPGDADWRPLPTQPDPDDALDDVLPLRQPLPLNLPASLDLCESEGGHHD